MTTVVVAGALANKAGSGGEAWVRMSWVDGLRRLGLDVWFVEEISSTRWTAADAGFMSRATAWFEDVVTRVGIGDRAALLDTDGEGDRGVDRTTIVDVLGSAELLVNISGHLRQPSLLALPRRRVYVDIDPGYTQIWHVQGADLGVAAHDLHLTVGVNLGRPSCAIPDAGFDWIPVLPPTVLEEWSAPPLAELDRFTTVASWRGAFGPIEHGGVQYGPKAHEFRRFAELPRLVDVPFEIALDIHPADARDRRLLVENGWQLVDPSVAAGGMDEFRRYVLDAAAEFSVAQGVYVHARSGWFSDRTARYLAAGRPALVQDTGLAESLPTGEGLLTFSSVDDAVDAAARLAREYTAHAEAAAAFAAEHLAAERILPPVLDRARIR